MDRDGLQWQRGTEGKRLTIFRPEGVGHVRCAGGQG